MVSVTSFYYVTLCLTWMLSSSDFLVFLFLLQQCASLLRSYCMGDGQVKFQLVSEPEVNFAHVEPQFRRINTEDPDLNINLPVYSIHGNHDDPSGLKYLSELDLLHTYGLINYFGKANDIENIDIYPLLFTKGTTKLALYGLGSIRDERLHRAYLNNRVQMKRPSEATDEWFNLFVLHQNRPAHRGSHNYIPESFLDSFLDLVVWGHEHDPIPEPEHNKERGFEVLQPGSSVATSMSDGEGKQKFCYVVKVCGRRYRVEPIALRTVRPFVIEEIDLKQAGFTKTEANTDTIRLEVETFLAGRMERIIRRVEETKGPHQPKQPLVRLRVDFGDIEPLNPILFGQKFFGRVANPKDIILPLKRKAEKAQMNGHGGVSNGVSKEIKPLIELDTATIEDVLVKYFDDKSDSGLMVFNSKFLTEALRKFVNNEDREAILDAYEYQKAQALQYLSLAEMSGDPGEELLNSLRTFRSENEKYMSDFVNDFEDWRSKGAGKKKGAAASRAAPKAAAPIIQVDESDEEMPPANGTANGRGRGAATTRARGGRARGARSLLTDSLLEFRLAWSLA
ncbi:MRE11C [Ramazzottius varieornatus]|uniref:MRE11C n=1 Tax=Ramazzottius varieornatus TaxID=947166 RepID=A0A1D1VHN9_RAMVA|nr:MRE11C [Ramazzottius varieornatus]